MQAHNVRTLAGRDKHRHALRQYVIGFLASIVLTLAALWVGFAHGLPAGPLLLVLLLLAVLQIGVQLFLFMHITEGDGPPVHSLAIALAFLFTFVFVAGSLWAMSFHYMVA
ncbi:cytochrome aa3 quinol oxidase subunit IV [Alicyclobacillus cellulosilyticus]|uniref:Cytochrome aa3 quinol oxidase subunit IV n=1 Tax=Alicyclobacillus cellulosilyticus TaxID=1003997 RepID=A0A917KAF3_9BACL|nr:cytochrome C oxidase subunit IV family protein [Alicyclobacillus cellulosilyticus]GGJ07039.1 cytochrome aa3 quinol oxidase subunit IV [Alicyclobacillus cellulosilyticus]